MTRDRPPPDDAFHLQWPGADDGDDGEAPAAPEAEADSFVTALWPDDERDDPRRDEREVEEAAPVREPRPQVRPRPVDERKPAVPDDKPRTRLRVRLRRPPERD
ncbi:MAG: hypothetical protein OSA99_10300 [Acidimicrobiales bacterium]|nr:hypothetical protein [Acidimicrobiales bacterium]